MWVILLVLSVYSIKGISGRENPQVVGASVSVYCNQEYSTEAALVNKSVGKAHDGHQDTLKYLVHTSVKRPQIGHS